MTGGSFQLVENLTVQLDQLGIGQHLSFLFCVNFPWVQSHTTFHLLVRPFGTLFEGAGLKLTRYCTGQLGNTGSSKTCVSPPFNSSVRE
jgi:hypothetical protein